MDKNYEEMICWETKSHLKICKDCRKIHYWRGFRACLIVVAPIVILVVLNILTFNYNI